MFTKNIYCIYVIIIYVYMYEYDYCRACGKQGQVQSALTGMITQHPMRKPFASVNFRETHIETFFKDKPNKPIKQMWLRAGHVLPLAAIYCPLKPWRFIVRRKCRGKLAGRSGVSSSSLWSCERRRHYSRSWITVRDGKGQESAGLKELKVPQNRGHWSRQ